VDPKTRNFDPAKRAAAFALIDHARQLNPLSPSVHLAKAVMVAYGHGDFNQAIELGLQSLAQDPNFYPALTRLAEFRSEVPGDLADAVRYAEQSLALEPRSLYTRHLLSRLYLQLDDYYAARRVISEAGGKDDAGRVPLLMYRREWRAAGELAYVAEPATMLDFMIFVPATEEHARVTHQFTQAIQVLEQFRRVAWSPEGQPSLRTPIIDTESPTALAEMLIAAGERERGFRLLRLMLSAMNRDSHDLGRGDTWFCDSRPKALALLGEREAALEVIQQCNHMIFPLDWWYHLLHAPAFDSIRQDARFQAYITATRSRVDHQRELLAKMRTDKLVPLRSK